MSEMNDINLTMISNGLTSWFVGCNANSSSGTFANFHEILQIFTWITGGNDHLKCSPELLRINYKRQHVNLNSNHLHFNMTKYLFVRQALLLFHVIVAGIVVAGGAIVVSTVILAIYIVVENICILIWILVLILHVILICTGAGATAWAGCPRLLLLLHLLLLL